MRSLLEIKPAEQQQDKWNGKVYKDQTYSKLQRYFGERVMEQVILPREGDNKGHMFALDIGCGDGYLTDELSQKLSCQVHGIDNSQSMVDTAILRQTKNPNLFFTKEDISDENLFFPKKYSLIVSFFCLHWVLKQEQVYSNIAKVLDENGHGYLLVSAQKQVQSNKKSYIAIIRELLNTEPHCRYFSEFLIERANLNKDNLPTYINNAGLNVVDIVEINEAYVYANKQELSYFFQGIVSGYLVFRDNVVINKAKQFEQVSILCDHLVNELVAQQSYKQLDDGKLESQQCLLLAIIEKSAIKLSTISSDLLLQSFDAHTEAFEYTINNNKL